MELGVSNYCRHLLTALGTMATTTTDLSLTAFVNTPKFTVPGVDFVCSRLPLQYPPTRIFWEQGILPWVIATSAGRSHPWLGQCAAIGDDYPWRCYRSRSKFCPNAGKAPPRQTLVFDKALPGECPKGRANYCCQLPNSRRPDATLCGTRGHNPCPFITV